jgi:broad specificity phosphatase PhoE
LPKYLVYQYEELREYNAGDWLGGKREDIFIEAIELRMERLNNTFQPPNGESMNQVERRASKWLEDEILYNKALIQPDMDIPLNIAVFSHGMTIKCLLHYIMGFDKNFTWKINIDNTSVTKLSFNHRGWFLNSINDCSHL